MSIYSWDFQSPLDSVHVMVQWSNGWPQQDTQNITGKLKGFARSILSRHQHHQHAASALFEGFLRVLELSLLPTCDVIN